MASALWAAWNPVEKERSASLEPPVGRSVSASGGDGLNPGSLHVGRNTTREPAVAELPRDIGFIHDPAAGAEGLASRDRWLLRLFLLAAGLVTVARALNAVAPSYDLSLQILAAQNLVAGRGLSWYVHTGLDLTDPPSLVTLTHFPAGYSLAAATLFSLGISVSVVVKLLGAAGTMAGWLGWGRLARPFFAEGLDRSAGWRWAAFIVAGTTPLFFTPSWEGTDLFLWATTPWVLCCLIPSADDHSRHGRALDFAAGLLCGLAFFMRYASAFLAAYAGVVILWQSGSRLAVLVRRLIFFGLGLLPLLAVQIWIIAVAAGSAATPGGLNTVKGPPWHRLLSGVSLLHNANIAWAFWLPGKISSLLFPDAPAGRLPWQLALTTGAILLLTAAASAYVSNNKAPSRDARLLSLLLFILVPGMLLIAMTLGSYDYVGDRRYYLPLVPLSLFVAYSIATMSGIRARTLFGTVARACGGLYVSGYAAIATVYALLLVVPVNIGAVQRSKVLAGEGTHWPSSAVVYELSPARELAMRLVREHPGSLLLSSRLGSFSWDPKLDRSRVMALSCVSMRARHVTGPARIVFVTFERGRPEDLWYYRGNDISGSIFRAECLDGLSGVHVVQRFPDEGLKVLEAEVAAGSDIVLHR